MSPNNDEMLWYVVHTKPQKELLAASMLAERLRLSVYLPEVLQTYRQRVQPRPFFPRYVFVQADLNLVEPTAINAIPGVICLVAFGDKPQALPPDMVNAIHERIDAINAAGGLPRHDFHPGDRVRLTAGPLQGLEAVFEGPMRPSQRVMIFLEFLGRMQKTEVPIEYIERISAGQAAHERKRTTRGRGRKIHYQTPSPP